MVRNTKDKAIIKSLPYILLLICESPLLLIDDVPESVTFMNFTRD